MFIVSVSSFPVLFCYHFRSLTSLNPLLLLGCVNFGVKTNFPPQSFHILTAVFNAASISFATISCCCLQFCSLPISPTSISSIANSQSPGWKRNVVAVTVVNTIQMVKGMNGKKATHPYYFVQSHLQCPFFLPPPQPCHQNTPMQSKHLSLYSWQGGSEHLWNWW